MQGISDLLPVGGVPSRGDRLHGAWRCPLHGSSWNCWIRDALPCHGAGSAHV